METLRRTRIADLFRTKPIGTTVKVKGWVRTRRGNKQVGFIALNDGSTIKNIQADWSNRREKAKTLRYKPRLSKCTARPIP